MTRSRLWRASDRLRDAWVMGTAYVLVGLAFGLAVVVPMWAGTWLLGTLGDEGSARMAGHLSAAGARLVALLQSTPPWLFVTLAVIGTLQYLHEFVRWIMRRRRRQE